VQRDVLDDPDLSHHDSPTRADLRLEMLYLKDCASPRSLFPQRACARFPEQAAARASLLSHSHSMVAGGFELTSYTTRFTPSTSLMIRLEMLANTSGGNGNQSAVIPSELVTARRATTLS